MRGSSDRHDERVPDDELMLYAFGELPPERVDEVERLVRQDPQARAAVAAMRRLGRLATEDVAGPTDALLAATETTMRMAMARKVRRRRIGIVAALGSVAAAAVIAVVVAHVSGPTARVAEVAEAPRPAASQPAVVGPTVTVGLSDADRRAIRQTIARMRRERVWDDPLDDRVLRLRRKIDRLSGELLVAPRATQPAGSTQRPAPTKEARHA